MRSQIIEVVSIIMNRKGEAMRQSLLKCGLCYEKSMRIFAIVSKNKSLGGKGHFNLKYSIVVATLHATCQNSLSTYAPYHHRI